VCLVLSVKLFTRLNADRKLLAAAVVVVTAVVLLRLSAPAVVLLLPLLCTGPKCTSLAWNAYVLACLPLAASAKSCLHAAFSSLYTVCSKQCVEEVSWRVCDDVSTDNCAVVNVICCLQLTAEVLSVLGTKQ
jgi:hypothetical protein